MLEAWHVERAAWLAKHPLPWDGATELAYRRRFQGRLEQWLDAGHGSCALREPDCSAHFEAALRHFDGKRYRLDSFVVMPNHVHLIVRLVPDHTLPEIVKSWKSFTALKINERRRATGSRWQEGYWDRLVRDASHLFRCREYIRRNPEKAKLAPSAYRLHISETAY